MVTEVLLLMVTIDDSDEEGDNEDGDGIIATFALVCHHKSDGNSRINYYYSICNRRY